MANRDTRHVNVVLDRELHTLILSEVQSKDVSISVVVRTALRKYFAVADNPFDAGWREGLSLGYQEVMEKVKRAIAELPVRHPGSE